MPDPVVHALGEPKMEADQIGQAQPSTTQEARISGNDTATSSFLAHPFPEEDNSDGTYELEEEESEFDEDLEMEYDEDEWYREEDIPDFETIPVRKAQRTPQMLTWRRENEALIERYVSEKAADLIETTNSCIKAHCFDFKYDDSLDDREDMIYHDLMKPHWTDEGILKWEASHQVFKGDTYDDLNNMMKELRSTRNPDADRINTYFPLRTPVPPARHPYDLVEGIYAMHILRMKRLLDRATFRLEDWVTTALAMEWARRTLLRSLRYMNQLKRKYPPVMMKNTSNSLLLLIVVKELHDKPCEKRAERVQRGRETYVAKCSRNGMNSLDCGLAQGDDMRVRWHCTPFE
ncbi:hypothetical protein F5B22DRAFT_378218 [Xylaria bambusicola]|uniref:uncharacterized protein n=1 Tax=Xylaria bambusicola TaxID=326684 RepID=UPI002007DD44|nr:uncharacterized protein F5B22DRAFT_378218 [Xylaria bambusicola]KAI0508858.1 hypothetical protein F5B22DRAFT_378218 [Xylaria bambusicola]